MAGDQNYVTEEQIIFAACAMIIVASIFFFARLGLRLFKSVPFQLEDLFILLAFLSFLALAIGYIVAAPAMYRVTDATSGMHFYGTIFQDGDFMLKIFFANTLLLWCVLWAVKLSFLFLYRRLFLGLSGQIQWWWAVFVFTVIVFIVCVVSNFTACESLHDYFTLGLSPQIVKNTGLCISPRDVRGQFISLYFSFAVDVITDIMSLSSRRYARRIVADNVNSVMLLPTKLLWSLCLPLAQKMSVGAVFCVGVLCILMATIRVAEVASRANGGVPSGSWLAFWNIIEAGIAVITGCLPAFTIIYRKSRRSRRHGSGYNPMPNKVEKGVPLSTTTVSTNKSGRASSGKLATPAKALLPGVITVTHSLEVSRPEIPETGFSHGNFI
ncbi:hypothetical protein V8E54_009072 [Elaphomyces granulatus]